MGRRGYPYEFRRRAIDLVEAGRPVTDVAHDLGISAQSIYHWRRQFRIDDGVEPGSSTRDRAELTAANARIKQLETQLAIAMKSVELLKETRDPKAGSQRSR